MRRVVVFTKLFWPEGSGSGLATYLIAKNILSKYFDVIIVAGTRNPVPDILKSCKYIYWGALSSKFKPFEQLKILASFNTIRKIVEGADAVYIPFHTLLPLAIAVKAIKPSIRVVLHLHNYQPLTFTSVVLAGGKPDIATDVFVELKENRSLLRAIASGFGHYINIINRIALLYADKIICVSRRQCEILEKYAPEIKGKTDVIYNPPPPMPPIEKRPSETPTFLYVGGDSYVKGFPIALWALSKLRHSYKAYITGHVSAKWANLINKLLGEKVALLGRIPYSDVLKLHAHAWALLFPSIWEEPLPYAVVEALMAGTIPVAFAVGGVHEVVENTPAERFLCSLGELECLTEKLETVVTMSPNDVVEVSLNLREVATRKFDINVVKKALIELLSSD